jgi:hypothetical protein
MKTYTGKRTASGTIVTVNGQPLNPRNDIRCHSPTGFEWGYGGSGSAQLALAILTDHIGDDRIAQAYYQDFKWQVIAPIQTPTWSLTEEQVAEWLAAQPPVELLEPEPTKWEAMP